MSKCHLRRRGIINVTSATIQPSVWSSGVPSLDLETIEERRRTSYSMFPPLPSSAITVREYPACHLIHRYWFHNASIIVVLLNLFVTMLLPRRIASHRFAAAREAHYVTS